MRVDGNVGNQAAIAAALNTVANRAAVATQSERRTEADLWGGRAGGVGMAPPNLSADETQRRYFPLPFPGPGNNCFPCPPSSSTMIDRLMQIIMKLIGMLQGRQNFSANANRGDSMPMQGAASAANAKLENVGGRMAVKVDGPQGFLWKPESDSDRKGVILLPKNMAGNVQSVVVRDTDGSVVSKAALKGTFGDGREIFRLPKEGKDYPPNSVVEVRMKDGSLKQFPIGDPAKRYD